jgi:putative ABC transport system permease protein
VIYILAGLFVSAALVVFVPVLSSEKGRRGLVLALRSLWLHKLRSFLSVLGIIIGTGAVVVLMGFGEGSMQDALEDIRRLGATNIIVRSVKPPDDSSAGARRTRIAIYGLTYDDFDRFQTIDTVTRWVPMRVFPQEVRHLEWRYNARVVATTPRYAEVNTLDLAQGRFLTEEDGQSMLNVAVLGSTTAEKLFPYGDPVGQPVLLYKQLYQVVGVLRDRMPTGGSGGSQAAEDFNSDVYIPLETCKVRFGAKVTNRAPGSWSQEQVELSQVTLTVGTMDEVRPAGEVVRELLDRYHQKADWAVTVPLDRLEEAERTIARYTILLFVIGGISLLVGGIGIMNIMLATVTERTREIGIRRALGAKRKDITLQFLIEAVVQTALGGLTGVALGVLVVLTFPPLWQLVSGAHTPAKINTMSIFLSLGFSVVIGVGFGLYPAVRAARLDPIEALRHE